MEKKNKKCIRKKILQIHEEKDDIYKKIGKIKKGENSEKELVKSQKTETNTWKILKQVIKKKHH